MANDISNESARRGMPLRVQSPLSPELDRLVYEVIGLGMDVHSAFGPGLREGVYEDAYVIALENRGLSYVRQVPFSISFLGQQVRPIKVDLVVEGQVIVEFKAVAQLHEFHSSQLLTYLKLTRLPVGIILTFNVQHLKDGIRRHIRTRDPVPSAPSAPPPTPSLPSTPS